VSGVSQDGSSVQVTGVRRGKKWLLQATERYPTDNRSSMYGVISLRRLQDTIRAPPEEVLVDDGELASKDATCVHVGRERLHRLVVA
jgi:hypothetical protein